MHDGFDSAGLRRTSKRTPVPSWKLKNQDDQEMIDLSVDSEVQETEALVESAEMYDRYHTPGSALVSDDALTFAPLPCPVPASQ